MRLFVALELEAAVAESVHRAAAPLRDAEPGLSWVPAETLHLTMKFFGEVEDAGIASLTSALDRVAARHRAFEMRLREVGAFPNFRRARVVWIGVESEPRLELLHHDLEIASGELGYEVEGRPFRPHVTLARVRDPLPVDRARRLATRARDVDVAAQTGVTSLVLMESASAALGRGMRYRRTHAAPLGGNAEEWGA